MESSNEKSYNVDYVDWLTDRAEILKHFAKCREYIEKVYEIKLSTIEAVGLRRITEEVRRQLAQHIVDGFSLATAFEPDSEIEERFFLDFFGIISSTYPRMRDRCPIDSVSDIIDPLFKKWLKIKQSKMHLI